MILIVDDDVELAETCSMFLEGAGFAVTVVASAGEALVLAGKTVFELVISDCTMPKMSGLDLSKALRANPVTAHVPILLMSGSMRCEVAQGTSYDAFLRKPFLAQNLLLQVGKLLDGTTNRARPEA